MARTNYGRHLPAFILLLLAEAPAHGTKLLHLMTERLPNNHADGPGIYRALNELEKEGAVVSCWDTSAAGAAKKCYTITAGGIDQLKGYKADIEARLSNLNYFLSEYDRLEQLRNEVGQ